MSQLASTQGILLGSPCLRTSEIVSRSSAVKMRASVVYPIQPACHLLRSQQSPAGATASATPIHRTISDIQMRDRSERPDHRHSTLATSAAPPDAQTQRRPQPLELSPQRFRDSLALIRRRDPLARDLDGRPKPSASPRTQATRPIAPTSIRAGAGQRKRARSPMPRRTTARPRCTSRLAHRVVQRPGARGRCAPVSSASPPRPGRPRRSPMRSECAAEADARLGIGAPRRGRFAVRRTIAN